MRAHMDECMRDGIYCTTAELLLNWKASLCARLRARYTLRAILCMCSILNTHSQWMVSCIYMQQQQQHTRESSLYYCIFALCFTSFAAHTHKHTYVIQYSRCFVACIFLAGFDRRSCICSGWLTNTHIYSHKRTHRPRTKESVKENAVVHSYEYSCYPLVVMLRDLGWITELKLNTKN